MEHEIDVEVSGDLTFNQLLSMADDHSVSVSILALAGKHGFGPMIHVIGEKAALVSFLEGQGLDRYDIEDTWPQLG